MSKIEALEKRVAELEAEVARLKAFPQTQHVTHSHYHYGQPAFVPVPSWQPYPMITYGAGSGVHGTGLSGMAQG